MAKTDSPPVNRVLLWVLLAAITIALPVLWLMPSPRTAPDLDLALLDGGRRTLQDFRGRPVLVSFWATNCAPCVEEAPDLARLHRELAPRGFELLAIAMPYDPPLHVQTFAREHALPYSVVLDVEGRITRAFGVAHVPMAFLIDPQGQIVFQQAGKLDTARMRRMIEALFAPDPHSPS